MAEPAPTLPLGSPRVSLAWLSEHRRGVALAVVLLVGVGAYLPSLRCELLLDDYLHAAMIDGTYPVARSPFDLYDFVDDGERSVLFERGLLPWWSRPDLRIRFLRPLPSALRWAEQRLVGRSPAVPHLHSLAWWVVVVLAARRLFERLVPAGPALLATIVFALSPCHALPIAWLANREALISLLFGTLAVTSYLAWRSPEGRARDALAAAGLFCLSLAAGEYALCFGGYVLALEAAATGERLARRVAGLAVFGAPAAVYLAIRAALGYGTRGSGFYEDPLHEPMAFLHGVPRRLATLLAQEWMTLDAETIRDSASPWLLLPIVVGGAALLSVPLARTFAALDPAVARRAKALLAGSLLALVPVLSVDPSPRVLGVAMLGLAPTIGLLLHHAWFPATPPERRGAAELTGLVALAVGFSQLVHGPATAWLIGERYRRTSADFTKHVAELASSLGDLNRAELVVVRGWDSTFFMPFALSPDGRAPRRWRVLSTTGHVLGLRTGPSTLELVAPKDQSLFTGAMRDLFRDARVPVEAGQAFVTPGLRATVLEVGPLGPRRVRFELEEGLDGAKGAGVTWLTELTGGKFEDASPPAKGFGKAYDP